MLNINILGCFFHLSKAFWKKVQIKGFSKQFEDFPDFRKFIKSCIALSHLPLEDLEKGVEYVEAMVVSDEKCAEFKEDYFLPYIKNCWIDGPFPPTVWSCFHRSSDLTNNNQEGFNAKINKELKQIHPNAWILQSFIKKQIKLSEMEVIKAENGLSKPKKRHNYKRLAKRRHKLKENYLKNKDISTYLAAMGNNLVNSEMSAGRTDDVIESQNVNIDIDLNTSAWRIVVEEDETMEDMDIGNNPYENRKIGGRQRQEIEKKKINKNKCTICGKGFNSKSQYVTCLACDKITHIRCVKSSYDEDQYLCIKCETNDGHDDTYIHIPIQNTLQETLEAEVQNSIQHSIITTQSVENEPTLQETLEAEVLNSIQHSIITTHPLTTQSVENVSDFLRKIEMCDLIDLFEEEMIDLDVLRDMSHEDLTNIGVKAFGRRHKIIKEIRNLKHLNIGDNIIASQSHPCPVFSLMNSDIDNLAESTKVGGNEFLSAESTKVGGNNFLSVTHVDLSSYDEMVDLSTRKRNLVSVQYLVQSG